jgi:hypothetical protein
LKTLLGIPGGDLVRWLSCARGGTLRSPPLPQSANARDALGIYGLGKKRSLDTFLKWAGVDTKCAPQPAARHRPSLAVYAAT